jgi:hypothetical protein
MLFLFGEAYGPNLSHLLQLSQVSRPPTLRQNLFSFHCSSEADSVDSNNVDYTLTEYYG